MRDERSGEINVTISIHRIRISASVIAVAACALLIQPALAERYAASANPDSPEGQFLDLIQLQSDEAKKLALIEQFTRRYPRHPAVSWAYEQLQLAAIQARQWDRALTFGEKLVQVNSEDMEATQLNIQAAESKGDRTTVKLWSDYLARITQRTLESPPPKDPEQLEEWKQRISLAAQFAAQDEYAIYKKALESGDPRQQIKLLDELLKRKGDYVLIKGRQVIGIFADRQEAIEKAVDLFGGQPALVKQIVARERIHTLGGVIL